MRKVLLASAGASGDFGWHRQLIFLRFTLEACSIVLVLFLIAHASYVCVFFQVTDVRRQTISWAYALWTCTVWTRLVHDGVAVAAHTRLEKLPLVLNRGCSDFANVVQRANAKNQL